MAKAKGKKVGTGRICINISQELYNLFQAEQEHIRVREELVCRPTYTEFFTRMWEAYQNSLTQKKAHRKLSYVGPERETTNLSDDNRVAI
jgi:hypothetical protein